MISRSTLLALAFACLATLSLAVVASVRQDVASEAAKPAPMAVYDLPRVVISAKVDKSVSERKTAD